MTESDIDIYDLTNFNYVDEPIHCVNVSDNKSMHQYDVFKYKRLFDENIGVKTIVIEMNEDVSPNSIYIYSVDNNSSKRLVKNVPVNINPYDYKTNTITQHNKFVLKIYPLNHKYDNSLATYHYNDVSRDKQTIYIYQHTAYQDNMPCRYCIVYMIDIISIKNSISNKQHIYFKDYIYKGKQFHMYFKIFKLNDIDKRMYINYITFNEKKIYFNKFTQKNKFIKTMPIEDIISQLKRESFYIYLKYFKFPVVDFSLIDYDVDCHFLNGYGLI